MFLAVAKFRTAVDKLKPVAYHPAQWVADARVDMQQFSRRCPDV
jgi:hypothetical protein